MQLMRVPLGEFDAEGGVAGAELHRNVTPEVLNMVEPLSEQFVVGDVEDTIEQRVTDVAADNVKILENDGN